MTYAIKNLRDVEDQAVKFGFAELQEARFPREDLGAETTGLAHITVKPGKRQPFAHRHREAEEIYVVLSGGGRIKLDDDVADIGPYDAVRISPGVMHAIEAGPDGIEILAFGPRHTGDSDMEQDFWGA
jgi:mannose-6-phosphate isomerase-like protein (cupin superfamily)